MIGLERELRGLASAVEFPPTPELARGVRTRLAEPRPRRGRYIVVVTAVIAVLVGAAFAVPQSRSAILRLFGLEGVTVRQVDKLPPVAATPAVFGTRTTLAAAERDLGFRPLLPALGKPEGVYVDAGYLILVYRGLRLSEFRPGGPLVEKLVKSSRDVEPVTVNGGRGLWIPSGHVVVELGRQPRLAGSALLWEHGDLTLRLEGRITKLRALEIARSVR